MATQDLSQRIIEAALDQFGRLGFDAASTRDIAKASGTAMSSITYHFGGKHGLYLACADHIADVIARSREPMLGNLLANPPHEPEQTRIALIALIENFARLMLSAQSASFSQFVVREQQHPTEAFERLYERMMSPVLETALSLMAIVRPSLTDPDRRALLMSIVGMALVLRLARECVLRVMQVADLDDATAEFLIASLRVSVRALLTED